ncbi:hypothetical protein JKF63_00504 [Porcisia hertigi]|uniref:Transmembrane protein n=1 Tax=Porcisia hertigi TaxID=2761500 RepID=A0A836KX78_9TRYP|nr:hypothetical protein JKF63_00504 [Porcisia hertigi]
MRRITSRLAASAAGLNVKDISSVDVPSTPDVMGDADGAYTLTASLLAWADAIIFGLVLCAVMNAVRVGWEKWNHYFHVCRARVAGEAAGQAGEEGGAQMAEMEPRAPLDFHEENETLENAGGRAEGVAGRLGDNAVQPQPVERLAPLFPEGAGEPRQPGEQAEARALAGEQDWGSESDSDGGDSDRGSDTPYRLSFVDEIFDAIDWVRSSAGGGGLKEVLPSSIQHLSYGLVPALLLRSIWGRVVVALAFAVFISSWSYRHKRNVLTTQKRRLHEVAERVPLLSQEAVRTLFGIYLVDAFFFYVALPELGGMVLHYAVAPYINVGFDRGFLVFFQGLTVLKVTLYWMLGAMLVMLLTTTELTVVGPLFANGVDLFFVRSFDARWDSVLEYWRCVVTQIFDADPLRIVWGFIRVALVELVALLIFVRMPFWGMLGCRDLLWGDGTVAETGLPLRMPLSLGMVTGYDINANTTFADWGRTEVLRVLTQQVLLPFGAMYVERLREGLVPMVESTSHDSLDSLVLAAANSTSTTPTAQELWEQVWGNMSDRSVFLFNLIDSRSAKRVAAASEGFRRTMERVQEPMEWLRVATSEDGVCNTLVALSSSAVWMAQPRLQPPPLVDIEVIVAPPTLASEQESTPTANAHQVMLDAWRRAYQEARRHIAGVLRLDAMPSLPSSYPEQRLVYAELDTMSAVKCYMATMQLSYPYWGMGRWRALAYEWWSLLLLRNTFVNYVIDLVACVAAVSTVLSCFLVYPIQRAQLGLFFPVVRWIGQRVVHMEEYLFDPEHLRAVEGFLEQDNEDELFLPPTAEPVGFDRREEYLEEANIPSHLLLRRIVVAVLFFTFTSFTIWVLPVLCGTFMMCFTKSALPVFLGAVSLSFFCWNPALFVRSVIFGMAFTTAILFAVPILGFVYIRPFVQLLWKSYPTLVEETFERKYNVHQMVGPCIESGASSDSSADGESEESWESVDTLDFVE